MQPLTNKKAILDQIDLAISQIGHVAYDNYVYGTTDEVDFVYVLKLERARRRLLGSSATYTTEYVKQLLTYTPYNG